MKHTIIICLSILFMYSCKEDYSPKKKIEIKNTQIIVNPFSVAPLTAVIKIEANHLSPKDVLKIWVKVLGKPNEKGEPGISIMDTLYPKSYKFKNNFFDITRKNEFNNTVITSKNTVEIPVLGLYADYNNKVEFEIFTRTTIYSGSTQIKTSALPDTSLKVKIVKAIPDKMQKGDVTWITADAYKYDFMFDSNGEIRWIIDVEGNSDLRILENGNFLIRSWWAENNFGEYNRLGESINRWTIPEGYKNHHDIIELPNSNLLLLVTRHTKRDEGYKSFEDCILEIDRKSNKVVNYWDLFELMDIANLKEVWIGGDTASKPGDWFHMNSICYDEIHDEIIVSGKRGGVIKLTRGGENGNNVNTNKKIVWYMPMFDQYNIYANHNATKKYLLTAVDKDNNPYQEQDVYHKDFHWMKYQHNPTILPSSDGLLHFLIFNNVYDKNQSTIVVYAVDEQKKTVKQVWQYGQHRLDLYCSAWSGVTWFPESNNRLMIPATAIKPKVEVTENKEVVFEFKISTNINKPKWYRGGRIKLYPNTKK